MDPLFPSPHILIIGDDEPIRALLKDLLSDEGFRCSALDGGDIPSTVADIGRLAPDLVVTDTLGHDAAGIVALLRSWRADPGLAAPPIVLCTAAVREVESVETELAALDVRVVPKPFDIDVLIEAVRTSIGAIR